jgi:hypothetical protein
MDSVIKAQFSAAFIVLQEEGKAMNFAFTKSTSLEECKPILARIARENEIHSVFTGNTI